VDGNNNIIYNNQTINDYKMNNKTIGIIAIVFGSLVLYSQEEYSWIISAIFIGIGTGIWFWKDKGNDTKK